MSLVLVFAVGIVCFLLLYFAFNLENNHTLLRFMLIIFCMFLMILLPKAAIDNNNYCDMVVMNQSVDGNVTSYSYDYYCETNSNTTARSLYVRYLGFVAFLGIYILVYFSKEALEFLSSVFKKT